MWAILRSQGWAELSSGAPMVSFEAGRVRPAAAGRNMIQVIARVFVWVLVIGAGYLLFGPDLLDSSRSANPFESEATLYLPPARTQRERDYERLLAAGTLQEHERAEYQALVARRQADFWKGDGVSVEQALAGVTRNRRDRLLNLLHERGISPAEAAVFLRVVERDNPALLADRD